MKILLAGASGAIGRRLVPLLVSGGHSVVATTRSRTKLDLLQALGAQPALMDGLDREDVTRAVSQSRPDVIVHQMTALAAMLDLKHFDAGMALTNQLRTDGTRYLLEAGAAAGVRRFVAQSFAGWPNRRDGGRIKSETDPLDPVPPASMRKTLTAIQTVERIVLNTPGVTGLVLRYGSLYGPGTSIAADGDIVRLVRQRRLPLIGGGTGVWSFVHVDDAARATQVAIERAASGLFNIVDDEPTEVFEWLPELARAVQVKPPMRLPAWIGRLAVGEAGVSMMTAIRGSSNAKAKRELNWQPGYRSWRDGFQRGLSGDVPTVQYLRAM